MNLSCTACHEGKLVYGYLEPRLPCHRCTHCDGVWLKLDAYLHWQASHPSLNEREEISASPLSPVDTKRILICPETGAMMLKFKVSNQLDAHVDFSSHSGGLWLDKDEWDLLKQAGLSDKLNHFATDTWQANLRQERAQVMFENKYNDLFGEANHAHLKDMKSWLDEQPNKREMLAYLSGKNPYSAR